MKKALVISGGGAKGAYAGGVSDFLISNLGTEYDIFAGTSTGALLTPLISIGEIQRLKKAYTNVSQEDIFKVNPFCFDKSTGKTNINFFKVGYNVIIKGSNTFGDSSNLRYKTMPIFFNENDFKRIVENRKNVTCCVTNLNTGEAEYKSVLDENMTYEDYCDWIFASSSVVPFMSIVEKHNYQYADGGMRDHIPLQKVIDMGAIEIDVIDLKFGLNFKHIDNPFSAISRIADILLDEVSDNDLLLSKLIVRDSDVNIRFFAPSRRLTDNSLIFDKDVMSKWWEEGYDDTKKSINLFSKRLIGK